MYNIRTLLLIIINFIMKSNINNTYKIIGGLDVFAKIV